MTKKAPLLLMCIICLTVNATAGIGTLAADIFKECAVNIITEIARKVINKDTPQDNQSNANLPVTPKNPPSNLMNAISNNFNIRWHGPDGEYSGVLTLKQPVSTLTVRHPNGTVQEELLETYLNSNSDLLLKCNLMKLENMYPNCPKWSFRYFRLTGLGTTGTNQNIATNGWHFVAWNEYDEKGAAFPVAIVN